LRKIPNVCHGTPAKSREKPLVFPEKTAVGHRSSSPPQGEQESRAARQPPTLRNAPPSKGGIAARCATMNANRAIRPDALLCYSCVRRDCVDLATSHDLESCHASSSPSGDLVFPLLFSLRRSGNLRRPGRRNAPSGTSPRP
jgi:hypothetical protein